MSKTPINIQNKAINHIKRELIRRLNVESTEAIERIITQQEELELQLNQLVESQANKILANV